MMLNTRYIPLYGFFLCVPVGAVLAMSYPLWGGIALGIGLIGSVVGLKDVTQKKRAVLQNYPVIARFRYLFESFRPEIRQYLLESDHDEVPYSREQRSLVYRRAKNIEGLRPFGTLKNLQQIGYEWINHSIAPTRIDNEHFRVRVGSSSCTKPYDCSVLNISGMSYGALSPTAIEALNRGAKKGSFAHTTGEGAISSFHKIHGGDLIWQIGSGYFGCRDESGQFNAEQFRKTAALDQVKMIEIKLSQGAKPGHGGILLAAKVTESIAEARGIPMGQDCISPAQHSAFSTPIELLEFIAQLRELSNGKPIGFKLCVGHPWEFFAMTKAMQETGIVPDFITIDGSEGGTGAAPVEFADHTGAPLKEGLMLVHNTLVGLNIRDEIKIIVSGKLISAFDIARVHALGADICNMARGFMFSLGCLQAQACHTGRCPTGVATQDPSRYSALDVDNKYMRVASFHRNTLEALKETVSATGLHHPGQLTPHHLMIRVSSQEVRSAASQYQWLEPGELLSDNTTHPAFIKFWPKSCASTFGYVDTDVSSNVVQLRMNG
jgi:glutamate synthase domain-containing protein 2